jgi:hypothetical protein
VQAVAVWPPMKVTVVATASRVADLADGRLSGMSWWLIALPLREAADVGVLDWATSAGCSRGVPDHLPDPQPLPTLADVLGAFQAAGCHGTAWFAVDSGSGLAQCPDPSICWSTGGLDLGEVSLHVGGTISGDRPLHLDAAVEGMNFRKPSGAAVLHAMCALTPVAGPIMVCHDSGGDGAFVAWPHERPEDLVADWPW